MTALVAVLGSGNGGLAAAADLTMRGHRVRLFSRSAEALQPIRQRGGITAIGEAGNGFARIELVTNDIAAAVRNADLVMLVVPATELVQYAQLLAPHLPSGQPLLLNPGGVGGSLEFGAALRAEGFDGELAICETSTLTYACRAQEPGVVRISNVAPRVPFAAFPARRADSLSSVVAPLYPAIDQVPNVLHTGLANINVIEHPPQALLNAGWIEHSRGDFYFYYDGTTQSVGRVIDRVDEERMALADALGVKAQPFVDAFRDAGYTTAEAAASGSAHVALHQSVPNRWFKAPTSLDHRYVHEDVGHGLVPLAAWASLVEVPTPVMDSLITIGGALTGRDYRVQGLTPAAMGINVMDLTALIRFLEDGPPGRCG